MNKFLKMPKLLAAYILYLFTFDKKDKRIILVSEKKDEARDNGYYFFKYAMQRQNENVFYIIEKNSSDLVKLSNYNSKIIFYDSFKHYYYYFLSEKMVSSQSYLYPIAKRISRTILKNKRKKLYWLQHGVTKDYETKMDYRYSDNVSLVCCASDKERNFFVENLNYPKQVAQNIGFCRFDGLNDFSDRQKPQILVMPTFRKWLIPEDYNNPTPKEIQDFKNSDFYSFYNDMINSKELIEILKKNNANIVFYLHYAFQPYSFLFDSKDSHIIIGRKENDDVQKLMKESSIMVTDFSSVAFDFAYMEKPVIYAHFDYEKYRENHYGEGYFSYEKDGFGPVITTFDDFLNYIQQYLRLNCLIEEKYRNRVTEFFDRKDAMNCERIYNFVINN